jgi:tetraacyldisaccharide 4'-kinase
VTGADRVWYGSDGVAVTARLLLSPFAAAFGAAAAARSALYDRGVLATHAPVIPCVSVGNLTVGGTGKTPFAAWLAGRFKEQVPLAIILRGYGADEAAVHRRLNPGVPVLENADRLSAALDAQRAGARVAVLDDAFQHRRIARIADIALLSVEQILRPRRMLPAGPWREPLAAARRAGLLVLTRKSASVADSQAARDIVRAAVPNIPIAIVHLSPHQLERYDRPESRPLSSLQGAAVHSMVGIGEPEAFRRQLEQLGARVVLTARRDHHAYSSADAAALAAAPDDATVVCTLKDAVKLGPLWPSSRGLWYVSQHLVVEQGAEHLDRLCASVLERASSAAAG